MEETKVCKTRGLRVSMEQIEAIIDFVERRKIILSGKIHPLNVKEVKRVVARTIYNRKFIQGAKKKWRGRFFIEYKLKIKKKSRDIITNTNKTEGGAFYKKLTELEERLIYLTGRVTIEGAIDVPSELEPEHEQEDNLNYLEEGNGSVATVVGHEESVEFIPDDPNDLIFTQDTPTGDKQQIFTTEAVNGEKRKQNDVPRLHESNRVKKLFKKKKSSTSMLEETAKIYAESSRQIGNAINNFAEST